MEASLVTEKQAVTNKIAVSISIIAIDLVAGFGVISSHYSITAIPVINYIRIIILSLTVALFKSYTSDDLSYLFLGR